MKTKRKYSKEYLKKIDKELELIPLTYDFTFKKIFASKRNGDYLILKKFLISVLRLNLNPKKCNILVVCNELPKENRGEYKKTLDINILLDNNIHLDIEMNNSNYENIKIRNSLYESKLFTMSFESGSKIEDFLKQYICQLNLNNYENMKNNSKLRELQGEDIIGFTSLKTGNLLYKNRVTILKYLDYYKNLYYNEPKKCKKDDLWLALLTSSSFLELDDYLEKLLPDEEREEFIKEAMNMSKDVFILHEWEKEKMDKLKEVEFKTYYKEKYQREYKEKYQKEYKEKYQKEYKEEYKKKLSQYNKELAKQEQELAIQEQELAKQEQKLRNYSKELEKDNIKAMLENHLELEVISKITKKPINEIKEIEKSMKD